MIEPIIDLFNTINKFRLVKRGSITNDSARNENDLEHSYSLAMVCWFINRKMKLGYDDERILKYSLTHDLVEIYAGDHNTYVSNITKDEKDNLELKAYKELKKIFRDWEDFVTILEEYEKKNSNEAKFVYSIDKMMSAFNSLSNNDQSYKMARVTKNDFVKRNEKAVKVDDTGAKIFDELLSYIDEKRPDFFME